MKRAIELVERSLESLDCYSGDKWSGTKLEGARWLLEEALEHIKKTNINIKTLRDYFAGQALAGITSEMKGDPVLSEWARLAYKFADAMLAEREKRNGKDND